MKRFVSILLAVCVAFSASFCVKAATPAPANFEEYENILAKESRPSLSTEEFLSYTNIINTIFRFFTGRIFIKEEHFNFKADAYITEICTAVADDTGLDILMLLQNMPESKGFAEFVNFVIPIDTNVMRDMFYEKRFEFDAKGQHTEAKIMYFLALYFSVIEECEAYCVPYPEMGEGFYEIYLRITVKDGTVEETGTGVVLDTVNNVCRNKDDGGILGLGYEFNYAECLLYTQVNVWMRNFGFCYFYDFFCYTTPFFIYNTRRIKFDYAGREWMIQIWKGNYLISNGAEVGIYNRDAGKFGSYYDCAGDEDMMPMSMKLYHGDELLFERDKTLHWWLTGFMIDDVLYSAKSMTLEFTIDMKDAEMVKAFTDAINSRYINEIYYTVNDLEVTVRW